jgi:cephalosporin-C deacetylase-like acetyl esterase
VLGTSGLLDGTCPPHTNIAPYNLIDNPDKEYHFYPNMTHDYPKNWYYDSGFLEEIPIN